MIEAQNITKTYYSAPKDGTEKTVATEALVNVSLRINRGEFVAIMGPSGSGKSTLMHILGALDTPTSGKYFLDDQDVSKLTDDQLADIRRDKIGFVFQSFNLLPRATVLRNVALPLVYANIAKEKRDLLARKALAEAGLNESHFYHTPSQLSGGQMQRVAIARALVNNPKIIFADEPTGNLDTKTGEIVLNTFRRLHTEHGRTIIMITHEQYVAQQAQRIINIRDGKVSTLPVSREIDIPFL